MWLNPKYCSISKECQCTAWKGLRCLSLSTVLTRALSLDTWCKQFVFAEKTNKDFVSVMWLGIRNVREASYQRSSLCVVVTKAGCCYFYPSDFSSLRAADSAARCVFIIAPKANKTTPRSSLTAWLTTSGTRSLWPLALLMSYYTWTAIGKMLRMHV